MLDRHPYAPRVRAVIVLVGILLSTALAGGPLLAQPTLTTITVDGNLGDWAGVLADPDNILYDGPGGGLADADAPVPANLDVSLVAYTWDATYLYVYIRRLASAPEFNYFWFHLDLNDDGRVPDNAPLFTVAWWGNNRRVDTLLDRYRAANVALGDLIAAPGGVHDGYTLPGTRAAGVSLETGTGGSVNGLEGEARVAWTALGVPAGTAMRFHLSTTRRVNGYPNSIEDNLGRGTAYAAVLLDPDGMGSAAPGSSAVVAHTLANTGNLTDRFDLTWSASGAFVPSSVAFYRDVDASGTLTPGDTPMIDTDGDTFPDSGNVAPFTAPIPILAVYAIPSSASAAQVATVTLLARSNVTPATTDAAVDTVTAGQPVLTLLKAVDQAVAAPQAVLTYTITYTNTGNADALAVEVTDPVPASTTFEAGSATGAGMTISWSHDGGLTWDASEAPPVTHVRWQLAGTLPPGASGTVAFQVRVD